MKKHPVLQKFLDDFTQRNFGRTISETQCVTCGSTEVAHDDFRDTLSRREFTISGMCQRCQDGVFK